MKQRELTAEAPAKLNLFLEVKGRRPDGYHEIETVMHAVDLCDTIRVRPGGREIEVECPEGAPGGRENIVYAAAKALQEAAGISTGAYIYVHKAIPAGAGLGGGSSDAATVLKLLNRAWETGFSRDRLAGIGAGVGSDVAFFFSPGSAICRGRGEKVEDIPCRGPFHFVILWPGITLATREVYQHLKLDLTGGSKGANLTRDALNTGNTALLAKSLFNSLENAALKLHASIQEFKKEVMKVCTGPALMTGSGSAVFGVCRDRKEAERARNQLQCAGLTFDVSSYLIR